MRVNRIAALVLVLLILPMSIASGSEEAPSIKPVESQDGWSSIKQMKSQELHPANHEGSCASSLSHADGPPNAIIDWVILPWESDGVFSDEVVAEGSIQLDGNGNGTTDDIALANNHYYDLLWSEDEWVTFEWIPFYLDECVFVFDVTPPEGYVIPLTQGFGVVDTETGIWHLRDPRTGATTSFFYGNPGDTPMIGDWDCDGDETPGLYRQSDGFVYLRNSNSQGVADIRFFFGNPGDVPLAGDFDNDGCDTVSIYRPSESRVFIINQLGADEGGLGAAEHSYFFGNPGDNPFVGDFDGDGIDTIGLHRESTGLVYFRQSHTQGNADSQFIFGDPGDKIMAADWTDRGVETVGLFRPSQTTVYLRHSNTQGNADFTLVFGMPSGLPVAGEFGVLGGG